MTGARLPSTGDRSELGLVTWLFCKLAARVWGVPRVHLFTTLGRHGRLLWSWLPFGGTLLALGRLPKQDAELIILRVGHLRGCEYELQQHRRIAERRGLDTGSQEQIFAGPRSAGLGERRRALLAATDELISTRTLSDQRWSELSRHLDRRQLIEFVTLTGQYDALAMTLNTLRVPLDYPE